VEVPKVDGIFWIGSAGLRYRSEWPRVLSAPGR